MQRREFLRSMTMLAAAGMIRPRLDWASRIVEPFDVYLTFDDGPFLSKDLTSDFTDKVIRTLKDHNAVATFFLLGRRILPYNGQGLVRYLTEGHHIGNHLWSLGGNLIQDQSTFTRLAYQYLLVEDKVRTMLQQTDQSAYQMYLDQPKLFRRPGGDNRVSDFLNPANFHAIKYDPLLRPLQDKVDWIKVVYDYSGWNVNCGDTIPVKLQPANPDQELQFTLHGRDGYYGVKDYLAYGTPPRRTMEADQGLIILMHDAGQYTLGMLPQLIEELRQLGANFRTLPRPGDKPNSKTVGIGYPPTVLKDKTF